MSAHRRPSCHINQAHYWCDFCSRTTNTLTLSAVSLILFLIFFFLRVYLGYPCSGERTAVSQFYSQLLYVALFDMFDVFACLCVMCARINNTARCVCVCVQYMEVCVVVGGVVSLCTAVLLQHFLLTGLIRKWWQPMIVKTPVSEWQLGFGSTVFSASLPPPPPGFVTSLSQRRRWLNSEWRYRRVVQAASATQSWRVCVEAVVDVMRWYSHDVEKRARYWQCGS